MSFSERSQCLSMTNFASKHITDKRRCRVVVIGKHWRETLVKVVVEVTYHRPCVGLERILAAFNAVVW